jgi:hypothetical protein
MSDLIARYRTAAAKLRKLEKAGTPGPWEHRECKAGDRVYATEIIGDVRAADCSPWTPTCGKRRWSSRIIAVIQDWAKWTDHPANRDLICASRNLLLPLLDAGDALADWLDCVEDLYPLEVIEQSNCNFQGGYVAAKAALAAIVEALERECGGSG